MTLPHGRMEIGRLQNLIGTNSDGIAVFATYLLIDDINQSRSQRRTISPSLDEALDAVRRLDGKSVRMVILGEKPPVPGDDYPFSGRALSVGGCDDAYIVEECDDHGDMRYLAKANAVFGEGTSSVMRGQVVDFDTALLVPRSDVLATIEQFYQDGSLWNPSRWTSGD